jgi:hypothetical protein
MAEIVGLHSIGLKLEKEDYMAIRRPTRPRRRLNK